MEINTNRNNGFYNMVSARNQDKEYPSNMGQKWSDEEEKLLLEKLNNNIDIEIIAQKHSRTIGGINSRRRQIAHKMYLKNISIEEIIRQTKLDMDSIKKIQNTVNQGNLAIDVKNMKNDIKDIKNKLGELVEMMKAVYEFEDT